MRYDEEFSEALGEEAPQTEALGPYAGKKKSVALLLVVLFGFVGLHDLYLDRIRRWSARLPLPLALVVLLNFTNVEGLFVQWTPQNIATIVVVGLMCLWWVADIIAILLMPTAAFDNGQDELEEEFAVAPEKEAVRHVAPYPKAAEPMLFADEDELGLSEEKTVKISAHEAQRVSPYPKGGGVALLADEGKLELHEGDIMDALAEEPPIVVPEPTKKKKEKPEKKKKTEKFIAAKADVPLEGTQPAVIVKLPEQESAAPKVVYVETRAKEVAEPAATEEPMPVPVPNMKTDSVPPPWKLHKKQQKPETDSAPQNVLNNASSGVFATEQNVTTEAPREAEEPGLKPQQAVEQPQASDDSTLQEIYTAIDKFDVSPLQQKYSLSEREARAVLFLTHCTREFGQSEDIIRHMVQHYRLLPKETTRIVETFAKQ